MKVWKGLAKWREFTIVAQNSQHMLTKMKNRKGPRTLKQITSGIVTTVIYHIWNARNSMVFKQQLIPTEQSVQTIKEQFRGRILLFLNIISRKYSTHIDRLPE